MARRTAALVATWQRRHLGVIWLEDIVPLFLLLANCFWKLLEVVLHTLLVRCHSSFSAMLPFRAEPIAVASVLRSQGNLSQGSGTFCSEVAYGHTLADV
ncbi:hypothetical protein HBH56_021750 [Parastagonospora nodorum]|uniref:Uncharacterized protein n=1 Tax=Phaeosphaeria nodorum (strain SN15 / ATCC MYA-4574 / FGSC 10173) TaxID=321614 RepID=A0A7U2EYP1_PHANO|nr:hypothetical protein HBH56_021750 [Parastagonospora nodorum]QRC95528.1 hypothetical protein JI435_407480 [Parastagonospora nodorum SN15]KAH3936954.1 hypothetical protein HBH54_012740 [Parastagonospora nodorum]KAH4117075.1 hypothetical protein HBH47_159460 [Parastagonospora nodorum]KAH4137058.1 hypothetical protein HBH45_128050 [Parastagonospora nodorum]